MLFDYPEAKAHPNLDLTVTETYTHDYNITVLHRKIRDWFAHERTKIPEYKDKQRVVALQVQDTMLTINQYRRHLKEHVTITAAITQLEDGTQWHDYVTKCRPLLARYEEIKRSAPPRCVDLSNNKALVPVDNEERRIIIENYLTLVRHLVPNVSRVQNIIARCSCGLSIKDSLVEDGKSICPCGRVELYVGQEPGETMSHTEYKDRNNFLQAFLDFEGRRTVKLPEDLFKDLDSYFTRIRVGTGAEVSRRLLKGKYREGTSRNMMIQALDVTGYSKLYAHANLIMHYYWSWPLPRTGLEERMMSLYDITQEAYNNIPKDIKKRVAAPNRQFRLYVQFKALGYPCSKDDFKIQITRQSLEHHQAMWKIICEKTETPFYAVL